MRLSVEQPAETPLVSGSSTRSLGSGPIGVPSSPMTFTVRNAGGVPLTLFNVTKDGPHAADFTLEHASITPLFEGGATLTVRVTFTPSAAGVRTAVLRVLTDDPVTPSFDIALTGTGIGMGNSTPTDILLNSSFITEHGTPGTVGTLAAVDADAGDTHIFTLVTGTGSTDNAAFTITGNQLILTGSADYETKSSYSIRIRATDAASDWTEKTFIITVRRLFESWAILNSLPSDPTANAGENLKRFAFGLNPDGSSTGPITLSGSSVITTGPPRVESIKNGGTFSFNALYTRRKDWQQAGLTYTVRFSGDLTNWVTATGTPSVIASDANTEAVVVRYPLFVNGLKARFFVVEVTIAP
ncbi:MAG: choice-of-anchor D domain-containing protein [Verrucomicrobia bacterium]|nr:choice-of-anchor D domain-containing protein [Verrucomicrobiota bacterium]